MHGIRGRAWGTLVFTEVCVGWGTLSLKGGKLPRALHRDDSKGRHTVRCGYL